MSIPTACRCCSVLSRPTRMRLAHSRSFGSTSVAASELKLPKVDWGAFKPKPQDAQPARSPDLSGVRSNGGGKQSGDGAGGSGFGQSNRARDDSPNNKFGIRQPRTYFERQPDQRQRQGQGQGQRQGSYGGQRGGNSRDSQPRQRAFGESDRGGGEEMYASNFGIARNKPRAPGRSLDGRFGGPSSRPTGRDRVDDIRGGPNRNNPVVAPLSPEVTELDVPEAEENGTLQIYESEEDTTGRRRKKGVDRKKSRLAIDEEDEEEFEISRGKGRKMGQYEKPRVDTQEEEWKRRKLQREQERARQAAARAEEWTVIIPSTVTVSRLATIFGVKLFNIQVRMNRLGMSEDQRRPDYMLNAEEACNLALEYGFNPVVDDESTFDIFPEPELPGVEYPLRPPVVTIMGHVDHGKTTLLDALRHTSVAAGEAGGITQHIGAFSVPLKSLLAPDAPPTDSTITFLDTPGHAAFTAMRARGASVTDIVVLVVAADDGVMPQTKEVLDLVKAEGDNVGLVVAINKIDKPGVDIGKVKSALGSVGVLLEEDGGDVQSVRVSGLSRIGLDNLVETLATLAELRDLRARTDGKAEGVVLESNVNREAGRGATVLVTRGTLKIGSVFVAGHTWCKVRKMTDDKGNDLDIAGPGTPVVITGWKEVPAAGDEILEAVNGEGEARKAVQNRIREMERRKMAADAEVINVKRRTDRLKLEAEAEEAKLIKESGGNVFEARLQMAKKAAVDARENAFKELRLVIKADVSGTVEAVEGALTGIGNKDAGVKIISAGVGEISPADVAFAEAAEAMIIGFNVSCPTAIKRQAAQSHTEIHLESVIYRLIETVRAKTAALLPPKIESRVIGEATVQQVFQINIGKKKTAQIAGCKVGNGEIHKKDSVRVLRGTGERRTVFEGKIAKLKHLKKEVEEIRKGVECGIQIEGFNDIKEGDEIVTFTTFEVPREL